jgi:protein TonB
LRWFWCLLAVVLAHGLLATALLGRQQILLPPSRSLPIPVEIAAAPVDRPVLRSPAARVARPPERAAAPAVPAERPKPVPSRPVKAHRHAARAMQKPEPEPVPLATGRPAPPASPKAASRASSPRTAPVGTHPSDSPAPAASWKASVEQRIAQFRHYPPRALRDHLEGTVLVRFEVARDGTVLSVTLVQSSGVADLDHEATALIRRASPLPAPPAGDRRSPMSLVLPVAFVLQQ